MFRRGLSAWCYGPRMRRIAIALMFGLTFAACDSGDGDEDDGFTIADDGGQDVPDDDERSVCWEVVICGSGSCTRDEDFERLETVNEECVDECFVEHFGELCGCPPDSDACLTRCTNARTSAIDILQVCEIDRQGGGSIEDGRCEMLPACQDDIFDPSLY